jgi:hypothetical protein
VGSHPHLARPDTAGHPACDGAALLPVTTQDFINFGGIFFRFYLLVLIENSQGFKTF